MSTLDQHFGWHSSILVPNPLLPTGKVADFSQERHAYSRKEHQGKLQERGCSPI